MFSGYEAEYQKKQKRDEWNVWAIIILIWSASFYFFVYLEDPKRKYVKKHYMCDISGSDGRYLGACDFRGGYPTTIKSNGRVITINEWELSPITVDDRRLSADERGFIFEDEHHKIYITNCR